MSDGSNLECPDSGEAVTRSASCAGDVGLCQRTVREAGAGKRKEERGKRE
jgi:hypothetical protein